MTDLKSFIRPFIKILLFIVVSFVAKNAGMGMFFLCQGLMIIYFWGTWFRQDDTQPVKKWNDFLNYIGLMCIITGASRFF